MTAPLITPAPCDDFIDARHRAYISWHFPARPDAPPGYRYVPGGGLYDLEREPKPLQEAA